SKPEVTSGESCGPRLALRFQASPLQALDLQATQRNRTPPPPFRGGKAADRSSRPDRGWVAVADALPFDRISTSIEDGCPWAWGSVRSNSCATSRPATGVGGNGGSGRLFSAGWRYLRCFARSRPVAGGFRAGWRICALQLCASFRPRFRSQNDGEQAFLLGR